MEKKIVTLAAEQQECKYSANGVIERSTGAHPND